MADAATRVVIIGGGFVGLYAARALKRAPVELRLVDRRNFHLFQPLLYQVATGGLSPCEVASPLRAVLAFMAVPVEPTYVLLPVSDCPPEEGNGAAYLSSLGASMGCNPTAHGPRAGSGRSPPIGKAGTRGEPSRGDPALPRRGDRK